MLRNSRNVVAKRRDLQFIRNDEKLCEKKDERKDWKLVGKLHECIFWSSSCGRETLNGKRERQRETERNLVGWQWADLAFGIFFSTFPLFFQFLIFLEEWTFWSLLDFLWAGCTTPLMVFDVCWFFYVKELFHFRCPHCCCNNEIVNWKRFTKSWY